MCFFQHSDILDIFAVAHVASRRTWKPSSIGFQQGNHLLKVGILSDLKGSFPPEIQRHTRHRPSTTQRSSAEEQQQTCVHSLAIDGLHVSIQCDQRMHSRDAAALGSHVKQCVFAEGQVSTEANTKTQRRANKQHGGCNISGCKIHVNGCHWQRFTDLLLSEVCTEASPATIRWETCFTSP
jgi:hypothetical protein